MARATRAQVPRLVTTSFPATPAAVYSAGSQPREIAPLAVFRTLTGNVVPSPKVAPFASIACSVAPVDRARFAPGKVGVGSLAATLRAPVPVAGDPSM